MTLPCLDLSLFTHGDAEQREELASQLLASLTDHGFVKLTKHGIPDWKIQELFEWVRTLVVYCRTLITFELNPDGG